MKLFVDAGNTRLKWCLDQAGETVASGAGVLDEENPFPGLARYASDIRSIAVSTVASEEKRGRLLDYLSRLSAVAACCYWAEPERGGLRNAYSDYKRMGADRWHAMYGAWLDHKQGFAVVDAGSAVTVDYVDPHGRHLGGYILPGLQMMLRSLKTDAARIGFDPEQVLATAPGKSTGECVNHGLAWLSDAMIARIGRDTSEFGLTDVLVTGGDAPRLIDLGLSGIHRPDLVLAGLRAVAGEEAS